MQTLYGMDASGVSTGAVKQIEEDAGTAPGWVPVAPPAVADGQIAIWASTQWVTQSALPTPAPAVPVSVTQRQARLALNQAGKLSAVDAAIAALPDPQNTGARIEWEYASTIDRNSALVATLGVALGITDADMDALFVSASAL
jgi:hypothetical protein